MYGVRGEILSVGAAYANSSGGSGKMTKNVDATQHAVAVATIRVATQNMKGQFVPYLKIFSDLA